MVYETESDSKIENIDQEIPETKIEEIEKEPEKTEYEETEINLSKTVSPFDSIGSSSSIDRTALNFLNATEKVQK